MTTWGIHSAEGEERSNGAAIATTAVGIVTPYTQLLEKAAENGNLVIFEKAMELEERWHQTQARRAFDHSMAQAKAQMPVVTKNQLVDFESTRGGKNTNYRYEDFADVVEAVQPVLSKYGLYLRHTGSNQADMVQVTCILGHEGGFRELTSLSAKIDLSGNKNHVQAIGSTITYLQRYSAKLALGLAAAIDDNGQGGGRRGGGNDDNKEDNRRPPSKREKTIEVTAEELPPYMPRPSSGDPHAIPTKLPDGIGRDPWEWGEDFKATLRQAKSPREVAIWLQLNHKALAQLSQAYPNVRAEVDECSNEIISGGLAKEAEGARKSPSKQIAELSEIESDQWRNDMTGALSGCESDEEIKKCRIEIDAAPNGVLKEHLEAAEAAFKQTVDRVLGIGK